MTTVYHQWYHDVVTTALLHPLYAHNIQFIGIILGFKSYQITFTNIHIGLHSLNIILLWVILKLEFSSIKHSLQFATL